jgi:very-short-patch-repair endonuclease
MADDIKSLFQATIPALQVAAHATGLVADCESPIEIMLGAPLRYAIEQQRLPVQIAAQHPLGRFRYDFAIIRQRDGKLLMLIECDGAAFHSSDEQRANDMAKDEAAAGAGARMVRFTGSEIYRDVDDCVSFALTMLSGDAS